METQKDTGHITTVETVVEQPNLLFAAANLFNPQTPTVYTKVIIGAWTLKPIESFLRMPM